MDRKYRKGDFVLLNKTEEIAELIFKKLNNEYWVVQITPADQRTIHVSEFKFYA